MIRKGQAKEALLIELEGGRPKGNTGQGAKIVPHHGYFLGLDRHIGRRRSANRIRRNEKEGEQAQGSLKKDGTTPSVIDAPKEDSSASV